MHISTRLVGSQGISVATVIGFSCRKYWQFFFCAYSVAVFCRILPYSTSYNILLNSTSYILPSSASHILPNFTVNTSRFKRAKDREYINIIGVYWRYRHILAGLNSFNGVIIVIIQIIRRKKAINNI